MMNEEQDNDDLNWNAKNAWNGADVKTRNEKKGDGRRDEQEQEERHRGVEFERHKFEVETQLGREELARLARKDEKTRKTRKGNNPLRVGRSSLAKP